MGYRYDDFAPGEIYHVFTRGVERRNIFLSDTDKQRFLHLLIYYLPQQKPLSFSVATKLKRQHSTRTKEGEGLVDLLCYCLMDNHIHLLVRENTTQGTSTYMRRVLNAYARHFNMKNQRSGPLFLHPFKAVLVDSDEQLTHVARYIHLNPYLADMVDDPFAYQWHSLPEYIAKQKTHRCHTALLSGMLSPEQHREFVLDEAHYEKSLEDINHLLIDNDD